MMSSRAKALVWGLLGSVALTCCEANAQTVTTFSFDFKFVSALTAHSNYGDLKGAFTATGGPASYVITSMSGTLGHQSVALLEANRFAGNDNRLIYPANPGLFSYGGVSFVAKKINYNLYFDGARTVLTQIDAPGAGAVYSGSVTQVGAPGPVAGVGLWSIGGFCLAGLATRLRRCAGWVRRIWRKLIPAGLHAKPHMS